VRAYIGFDDTDVIDAGRGTGKLARWFENELPQGCSMWGVVRQQLLVHAAIPYTSHNSSACVVVECLDSFPVDVLVTKAVAHIESYFIAGSDPGLCVCQEDHPDLDRLIVFGLDCARRVVTQEEALQAAGNIHLSGHGGTNDGIIGAAAAVGLTVDGWRGRFIEYGRLREYPAAVSVERLEKAGILVVGIERDGPVPLNDDLVETNGWLRPRLIGGKPVVPVSSVGEKLWGAVGGKRPKNKEG
jgi:tRNA(Ile2) C34 agmatinyltransferase TiaS